MIQNKIGRVQAHLIFSSQHVHSKKVGIETFDLNAILYRTLKLPSDNKRFAEQSDLALQIHWPLLNDEAK